MSYVKLRSGIKVCVCVCVGERKWMGMLSYVHLCKGKGILWLVLTKRAESVGVYEKSLILTSIPVGWHSPCKRPSTFYDNLVYSLKEKLLLTFSYYFIFLSILAITSHSRLNGAPPPTRYVFKRLGHQKDKGLKETYQDLVSEVWQFLLFSEILTFCDTVQMDLIHFECSFQIWGMYFLISMYSPQNGPKQNCHQFSNNRP